MKLSILFIVFLTFPGCFQKDEIGALKVVKQDYFNKKIECAKYIETLKKRLEKENLEEYEIFKNNEIKAHRTIEKICYSIKYNTCVALLNTYHGKSNSFAITFKEFEAINILTDETIVRIGAQWGKPKSKEERDEIIYYKNEVPLIEKDINCAE